MWGHHHDIYTLVECYTVVAFSVSNSDLKSIDLNVCVALVSLCYCFRWLFFLFPNSCKRVLI